MQIGIYIDVDRDGDYRMRCDVGNMNNQSLVLVSQLVSTWKPWARFISISTVPKSNM